MSTDPRSAWNPAGDETESEPPENPLTDTAPTAGLDEDADELADEAEFEALLLRVDELKDQDVVQVDGFDDPPFSETDSARNEQ